MLSLFVLIKKILDKKNIRLLVNKINRRKTESYLLLFLLLTLSISILQARDIPLFLFKYASLIFSFVIYMNLIFFENKINKYFFWIISIWIFVNISNDLFLLFYPNLYLSIMSNFLQYKEIILFQDLILRNRLTISTYVEIFLPILFYLYFNKNFNNKKKIFVFIGITTINIVAIYSGWRTRVIICVLSWIQLLRIYPTLQKKDFYLKLLLLFLVAFIIMNFISNDFMINNPLINRLLYENKSYNNSDLGRIRIMAESLDIFKINPLFGVGLNNNYIYRSNPKLSFNQYQNSSSKLVREAGSHNVYIDLILDTGIVGFIPFILLLGLWFYEDIKNFRKKNQFPFVLSYYLILFYALFQSIVGFRFFSIIFLLRSIIKTEKRIY